MKCRHAQHRLLATSGQRKLSAEVLAHLESCAHCQQWRTSLAAIDRAVPRLPVPNSAEAKAELIEQILAEPALPRSLWDLRHAGTVWQKALVGLAAGVLLILVGSAIIRGGRSTPGTGPALSDPLLAQLLERNLTLAKDPSAKKTVETLALLADDLDGETRNLARVANADDLKTLADLYDDVIRKGMLSRAQELPEDDRKKVLLPIADGLFQTSRKAEQLALEVPQSAAGPLKKIAAAARDANTALRLLTKDEKITLDTSPSTREGKS